MTATWHIGDTRTILKTLPDASVDLVLTSGDGMPDGGR